MLTRFTDLEKMLETRTCRKKLVLAAAQDSYALDAVAKATAKGFIEPVLVGNSKLIEQFADEIHFNLNDIQVIDEPDVLRSIEIAVRYIHDGFGDILMKGACSTAQILKGILNREWGLRQGDLLSHIALFEIPAYHKLLGLTDAAINIAPDLKAKAAIIDNAADFLHRLGIPCPKVAALASIETLNEQMQATVDGAALARMNREHEINGCIVEGPMALDLAINRESAIHKNISNEVVGDADLLLVPAIDVGNVLYKSFSYFAHAKVAAAVIGASAPVVLTSRSDSEESKLDSILLAAALESSSH